MTEPRTEIDSHKGDEMSWGVEGSYFESCNCEADGYEWALSNKNGFFSSFAYEGDR